MFSRGTKLLSGNAGNVATLIQELKRQSNALIADIRKRISRLLKIIIDVQIIESERYSKVFKSNNILTFDFDRVTHSYMQDREKLAFK